MSRKCDFYREQAQIDGMHSPAANRWRLHSKNCHACLSEIRMLETLCRDASEQRQHISHKDYAHLMNTVRQLYQPSKEPHWISAFWGFFWKTSSLAALLLLVLKIVAPFGTGPRPHTYSNPKTSVRSQPFNDTFSAGTDQGQFLAAAAPTQSPSLSKAELGDLFNSLPGTNLEQELQKLRHSVAGQIDNISKLLDRELNGEL